jgi:two-component system probable response regulator PhcQ
MADKILLVDDEPHIIKALKRALHDEPYEVVSAATAMEAMAVLKTETIDVIISDEKMPGMTGAEFLAEVCREYPETVRIILTGQPSLEAISRAINQGEIFRFLTKPWDDDELISIIEQALRRKKLQSRETLAIKKDRERSEAIRKLESEVPGITRINKDADGAIVVDVEEDLDEMENYLASFSVEDEA